MRNMKSRLAMRIGLLLLLCPGVAAHADIVNGSFESGIAPGWSLIGLGGTAGAKLGGPTDGLSQLDLLTGRTGSGGVENTPASPQANVEAFLSIAAGTLDTLGNGNAVEGSAVRQVFQGDAGEILMFDWNLRAVNFNDFAFVSLVGTNGVSTFTTVQTLASRNTDIADANVFQTFAFTLPFTATYTLGIGVMDESPTGNNLGISELLADNVTLTVASIPEPGTLALLATGLMGLAIMRRRRR